MEVATYVFMACVLIEVLALPFVIVHKIKVNLVCRNKYACKKECCFRGCCYRIAINEREKKEVEEMLSTM